MNLVINNWLQLIAGCLARGRVCLLQDPHLTLIFIFVFQHSKMLAILSSHVAPMAFPIDPREEVYVSFPQRLAFVETTNRRRGNRAVSCIRRLSQRNEHKVYGLPKTIPEINSHLSQCIIGIPRELEIQLYMAFLVKVSSTTSRHWWI